MSRSPELPVSEDAEHRLEAVEMQLSIALRALSEAISASRPDFEGFPTEFNEFIAAFPHETRHRLQAPPNPGTEAPASPQALEQADNPTQDLHPTDPPAILKAMADPTREEIDAKLAAVEARNETRYVELGSKIDRLAEIARESRDAAKENATTGRRNLAAIILTVIATGIGVAATVYAGQANILSAFQAGLTALSTAHR